MNIYHEPHDYSNIIQALIILILASRRDNADLDFLYLILIDITYHTDIRIVNFHFIFKTIILIFRLFSN
jgi:hypothetical protein